MDRTQGGVRAARGDGALELRNTSIISVNGRILVPLESGYTGRCNAIEIM